MKLLNVYNISLQKKLVFIIMFTSIIAIGITITTTYFLYKKSYVNGFIQEIETLTSIIGDNNSANILFRAEADAQNSLESLAKNKEILVGAIYNENDELLASYLREDVVHYNFFPLKHKNHEEIKNNTISIYRPIGFHNEIIGTVFVESSMEGLMSEIREVSYSLILITLLALFIAFLLSSRLQKIISSPLIKLAQLEKEVSQKKDYSIRVKRKGNDEIGQLMEGFNEMLEQIEQQNTDLVAAKESAIESEKAKENFLANMSHEIRTPMNAIIGMSKLLQESVLDQDNQEYARAISTSAQHLLIIVNDILDFSKLEAGKLIIENISFDLKNTMDEIFKPIDVEDKKIKLGYTINENAPKILIGDPFRLKQILINLVNNAIKFTSIGKVWLHVKVEKQTGKNITLLFEVSDTGIGIPENKMKSIFESFKQADTSTSRLYGGTGLGLAICKELTELQSGRLWVESQLGEGSTFKLILPYSVGSISKNNKPTSLEEYQYEFNGVNILCVDDYEMNLLLVCAILKKWNIKVDTAPNGAVAIEKIRTGNFDLVLMDVQMPVLDGLEATKIIRTQFPENLRKIPIIAFTANAIKGEEKNSLNAGMNAHITKPFDPLDLYYKIIDLLPASKYSKTTEKQTPKAENIATETHKSALYNLDYLHKMSSGDEKFVQTMLDKFLMEIPHAILDLQTHCKNKNWIELGKIAHKLKPMLEYMAIHKIKPSAETLQFLSEENPVQTQQVETLSQEIINTLQEVLKELQT